VILVPTGLSAKSNPRAAKSVVRRMLAFVDPNFSSVATSQGEQIENKSDKKSN
jgi:hypothetical protein